jgi:DNA-directed RNA polymerase specialized sigma24 family protein
MVRKMNANGFVAKAQAGDEEAMNCLLEEAEGFVFDFTRSHIANAADADDVAAEVLSEVWMNLPKRAPVDDFNGWLSKIVWNRINDYFRKQGRLKDIPESRAHREEIRYPHEAKRDMKEAENAYRGRR